MTGTQLPPGLQELGAEQDGAVGCRGDDVEARTGQSVAEETVLGLGQGCQLMGCE